MVQMGRMMDAPLLLSSIIKHAARHCATREVVSRLSDGGLHRYTYADCDRRARMLADSLCRDGVDQGDRLGTLAGNPYRPPAVYSEVYGLDAICPTITHPIHTVQLTLF